MSVAQQSGMGAAGTLSLEQGRPSYAKVKLIHERRKENMANATHIPDMKNQFEELKNKGDELKRQTEQTAAGLMDKARESISAAGDRVDAATHAVGEQMTSVAESMRGAMSRQGVIGTATEKVAGTLESGGRYLQEEGVGGIVDDITELIRRNPLPALCLGFGLGFIAARMLRR
jgi:hypothetical protein